MLRARGGFWTASTCSTPPSSASARARRWRWTRSSGCCSRRPGRRWRTPAIAPERLAGSATGVFVGISSARLRRAAAGRRPRRRSTPIIGDRQRCTARCRPDRLCARACTGRRWRWTRPARRRWWRVHLACRALRAANATLALAGGVNLIARRPTPTVLLARRHAVAGRPLQGVRRGGGRLWAGRGLRGGGAEAAGRTRSATATASLAVIRGSAVNQDGAASGLTVPERRRRRRR